jgi:glutathione peroxidase
MIRSLAASLLVIAACHSSEASGPAPGSSPTVVYGDTAKAQEPMKLPAAGTAPTPVTTSLAAIWDVPLKTLSGAPTTMGAHKGKALLVVNVASKCGYTPQYAGLEALEDKYKAQGFDVIGFPCNQFGGQEPGSAEQIQEFCSATYGVTFPMMAKSDVNGAGRNPIYQVLTAINDTDGKAGDVQWNFEKFLISADGTKVTRFRSAVTPADPALIGAIEAALPKK